MSQTIVIDPVTRIEGHSKITIRLDARGEVADAHFHVTQFRGFERITQGRPGGAGRGASPWTVDGSTSPVVGRSWRTARTVGHRAGRPSSAGATWAV